MNCDKCGVENPSNANFCFECGVKIKTALYAFLAQAENFGIPGFGFNQTAIIPRSPEEYIPKIRESTGCLDSEVIILKPEEWNPPRFSEVSQAELTAKFPQVLTRVKAKIKEMKLPDIAEQELINSGSVVPNIASGKIFFIFKIP